MPNTDWSAAKGARVDAARRPRPIIFNDDTHELALDDANTPQGFLGHRITPLAGLRYEVGQRAIFDSLTAVAFQGRRKMVRNTLGAWITGRCGEGAAERAFEAAEIRPDQRPETVSIERFAALSNWVTREERD